MYVMDSRDNKSTKEANLKEDEARTSCMVELEQGIQPPWARHAPGPSPQTWLRNLPPAILRYGIIACGCIVMMLSGYNHALMGSVSALPSYLRAIGLENGDQHSSLLIGTINALYYIGVAFGSLIIGSYSDRVGRRKAIVSSAITALVVLSVFTALQNFAWALVGRLCLGLFIGAFDAAGLNWSAETAKSNRRGLAIGLSMSCASFGACQCFFISYGLSKYCHGPFVWRFAIAFQAVHILIITMLSFSLPESPRWLIRVGRLETAREVLSCLQGDDGLSTACHKQQIDDQLRAMQQALIEERLNQASSSYLKMLFRQDRYRTARRTWTSLFIQFSTQFCIGAGLVATYSIRIFQSGGWPADIATLLAGIVILTQAIFGIPGAIFSDRIGRRPALIGGALFGSVILILVGMCGYFVAMYAQDNVSKAKQFSAGSLALMLLWSAQFAMTWLGPPFTYLNEIAIAQSRAKGSAFGVVGFGLGSFLCNMISPYLFSAVGYSALFLFGGLSFMVGIVLFFIMPETANKSLEEIDHLFDKD